MTKLLLIDDDVGVLGALSMLLEFDGYRIRTARTTVDARAIIGRERIDAVLTDAHIPGDDVLEFLEWLARAHPAIHVIVCSGAHDELASALASRAEASVGKYEGMEAISSAIRRVVGSDA